MILDVKFRSYAAGATSAQHLLAKEGTAARPVPPQVRTLGEANLQEFAQFGRRLELWNGIEFLECRCEGIGELQMVREFLVLRFEVQVVNRPCEVLRRFQFALHKSRVDDHLGCNIGEFVSLPRLHLLSHRFEVALHPVDANRDAMIKENDFECLANTGVNAPETMFPRRPGTGSIPGCWTVLVTGDHVRKPRVPVLGE